jgi:catechol 2,3-dioxygenase-like lactoylglutathione lyase family enzyme
MMMQRLHHVQLAMPRGEEEAARGFYVSVIGMMEIPKPEALAQRGGAWFHAGGVDLHLGVEDEFRPARKAHPAMLVDDLDDLVARLTAAGQRPTVDAEFPGFRRIYAADSFGNRLEFLEPSR